MFESYDTQFDYLNKNFCLLVTKDELVSCHIAGRMSNFDVLVEGYQVHFPVALF